LAWVGADCIFFVLDFLRKRELAMEGRLRCAIPAFERKKIPAMLLGEDFFMTLFVNTFWN
jgi:hypothetical protein